MVITGNEFTEYNFHLLWLQFFPCFSSIDIIALVLVMCTGYCQFIQQGLKGCFTGSLQDRITTQGDPCSHHREWVSVHLVSICEYRGFLDSINDNDTLEIISTHCEAMAQSTTKGGTLFVHFCMKERKRTQP